MSAVSMPNRRAISAWPNSWSSTQKKPVSMIRRSPPSIVGKSRTNKNVGCRNTSIPATRPSFQESCIRLDFLSLEGTALRLPNVLYFVLILRKVRVVLSRRMGQASALPAHLVVGRAVTCSNYWCRHMIGFVSPFQDARAGNQESLDGDVNLRPVLRR